jgi:hypothetical protein
LFVVVVVFFGLIIAFHLGSALAGKPLFRASHLGAALQYADAKGPISISRPFIVGFNANEVPTALELPIWQATVGLVFKATHSRWYGWANVVSLLAFATCLWPLFQVARELAGDRAAWWALIFFLSEPLIVIMAGEGTTDGFCLAVTIWFVFFAGKLIRNGNAAWWFPVALFAALAAVSKLPFFMAAGLYSAFLLSVTRLRDWKAWISLASAGAVAVCAFLAWTHYTDSLSAQAQYPYVELRLSHSPGIVYWWFGDLHYRLRPGPWIKGGWRFLHATLGSLCVTVVLLAALIRRGNTLPKLWLLATFLVTLIFTHVVLIHWHYYLMCCPAVALLCGSTIEGWENAWAPNKRHFFIALAGIGLVLSAVDGIVAMKIGVDYDGFPREMGLLIREHTRWDDKLIVYSESRVWGGEELFRAGRKGFYVQFLEGASTEPSVKGLRDLLSSPEDLKRLKALGYNKLVLISESPVRFAIEAVNPGSHRKRQFFPQHLSPMVDSWPVAYMSEDLVIKEIP